ncbi:MULTISPECIES: transporter substrate-binding domain-containing protein [Limnospira]|uniref:transporter substrate-binding domain-containing protein n=1 Tax=Limnospira TaxID=2596745 RepID=UPI0001C383BE|nr:ABC transporter substrate-binding protein [Arthrospira platensis str. Paraca]MDT9310357.1 transporter substrate-binding domain-containing protein [Limnospira sp. Paracas R14]
MKNIIRVFLTLTLCSLFPLNAIAGTVLEDIRRTGILKAGVRQDAAPLGYLSPDTGEWEGYCIQLMELLASRLTQQLQLNQPVQVQLVQSTLDNRESIVADGSVHLECGPNTVTRTPPPGMVYSDRFIATGNHLLVAADNQTLINPDGAMENIIIGVLPNTLTQGFISSRYSLAQIVQYHGTSGRADAVRDVLNREINAFASDGLLLVGEVLRQPDINPQDYAIIPQEPLTCEFYGMIVPEGDIAWLNTINSLILVEETLEILQSLYGRDSAYVATTQAALQKCTR